MILDSTWQDWILPERPKFSLDNKLEDIRVSETAMLKGEKQAAFK